MEGAEFWWGHKKIPNIVLLFDTQTRVIQVMNNNMNDVVNRHENKPKDPITTVPKREIYIVLPFLGFQSKVITQQLKSCIYKFYGCFNVKIIFRNTRRIKSFFPYKDRFSRSQMSKVARFTRQAAGTVMIFI